MAATVWLRTRVDLVASAAGAALLAGLLVWLGPPGTDLAAHVYQRTLFLEHGFVFWNNFWYSGRYSFVTYSVLYYPLAAVVGIKLLAVLIVAISVASFAVLVRNEWGEQSKWAIRAFAVVWAALVLSAAYPFMLGIALALLALRSPRARSRFCCSSSCSRASPWRDAVTAAGSFLLPWRSRRSARSSSCSDGCSRGVAASRSRPKSSWPRPRFA
jgi:hypothetical protein